VLKSLPETAKTRKYCLPLLSKII